jgi:hypothetical protein
VIDVRSAFFWQSGLRFLCIADQRMIRDAVGVVGIEEVTMRTAIPAFILPNSFKMSERSRSYLGKAWQDGPSRHLWRLV